ncbi:uncharacterized protein [Eucyclogobius newberryi]|uniref:uncharacterized protein n=1 Tax=Eucyclogobius newberryi TaxID=166745 RepID=UPI003B5CE5BB
MAMHEVEPYIFDPDSESEIEMHEEPRRQDVISSADRSTYWSKRISSPSYQPGSIEVTFELDDPEDYVSEPEVPAQSDEGEDDYSEEDEEGKKGDASSDEDWLPQTLTEEGTEELKINSSSEDSGEEEELDDNRKPSPGQKKKQLCTECGAFYQSLNHICEYKTKPYVCNVCGKRCVTQLSLKLHNNIHSETYQHYCKYCYATFQTKLDKLAHEEIHLNDPQPYKCPDCDLTFVRHGERRKHMKKHRGPNEFKCDICGFSIGKKHKLRHMMIHTGAKPFKCLICDRTFNQSGNLKSHMRVHTGEQPYKCHHCDKSFNHNVSLKSHIQRYHPLESDDKDAKSSDGVTDTSEEILKQDTETIQQKVKRNPQATGRPLGRPKKPVTSSSNSLDESQDFKDHDDCSVDLHNVKQEPTTKIKLKMKSESDSDYDPDKETCSSGKQKGRPRKT